MSGFSGMSLLAEISVRSLPALLKWGPYSLEQGACLLMSLPGVYVAQVSLHMCYSMTASVSSELYITS